MSDKSFKILIAENNQNVALDLKQILEFHKCNITGTFHSGIDVINEIKKTSPDLLIYSLLTADSKSLDSIIYYQKRYRFRIIFLAGTVELKHYGNKLKSDLIFFLKKPYSSSELLSLVEKSLNVKKNNHL